MSQTKYDLWIDLVRKVSNMVIDNFPEMEVEDLEQELIMAVLGDASFVSPDDSFAARNLKLRADKIAWKNRRSALYLSAQYSYRTGDVKRLLECGVLSQDPRTVTPPGDYGSSLDDRVVCVADVTKAFTYLPAQYKKCLYKKYIYGVTEFTPAEAQQIKRAVNRLTDILNYYDLKTVNGQQFVGPGSRKAISNEGSNRLIGDWY